MEENMKPEDAGASAVINDFVDFINCVNEKVKPHNELLYNIIMNAFEMMVLRYENDDIQAVLLPNKEGQCCACGSKARQEDVVVPEDIESEVDDIISQLSEELEKEI